MDKSLAPIEEVLKSRDMGSLQREIWAREYNQSSGIRDHCSSIRARMANLRCHALLSEEFKGDPDILGRITRVLLEQDG
jgi:hypothetical protein